jgi:hypothetical protein
MRLGKEFKNMFVDPTGEGVFLLFSSGILMRKLSVRGREILVISSLSFFRVCFG